MTHLTEEDQILLYYREPGVPQEARTHLEECAYCRQAAHSLARTLDRCEEFTAPEPPPDFERAVWAQLAPQLRAAAPRRWFLPRTLSLLAAAAVLLACAFLAGRWSRTPRTPSVALVLSNDARERILALSLADHLDRAGMLLTEISNSGEIERSRAEDLADEGRLLRQILARQGDSPTLRFLDDVERFIVEAANTPDPSQLQRRIGSESLLFKVRVIESNLRSQGKRS